MELHTKCSDAIRNSTLIESQEIKRSAFATYVEGLLSGRNKRQRTRGSRGSMMFCLSLKCLLEMNLSIEILNLSRMFTFQIQYSTPINQNPYPMGNVPYSTAGGSSSSTYTMETVPTRGTTELYMDLLNSSN